MGATATQTDGKKRAFLASYAEVGTIRGASESSGVSTSTHYGWLESDEEYAEAFEAAQNDANDRLEEEARRRAVEGWNEPVFSQGVLCGHKRKYSDTLLIFLLKGNNPGKFGDKVEQTHKGDASSPVTLFELPRNGREAPSETEG